MLILSVQCSGLAQSPRLHHREVLFLHESALQPSIHPSSLPPPIHRLFIPPSIHPTVHSPNHPPVRPFIHRSNHPASLPPSIHPSIHSSILSPDSPLQPTPHQPSPSSLVLRCLFCQKQKDMLSALFSCFLDHRGRISKHQGSQTQRSHSQTSL